MQQRQLQTLAFEVYDRLYRPVKRVEAQGVQMGEPPGYLQYPYFTLAPENPPKPALTLVWPLRSYDVLNKGRLIHGAYGYDARSEMLVAFAVDAEGEKWDVRTWREKCGTAKQVENLWEYLTGFATASAIEWRLTISHLGSMTSDKYTGKLCCFRPDRNADG